MELKRLCLLTKRLPHLVPAHCGGVTDRPGSSSYQIQGRARNGEEMHPTPHPLQDPFSQSLWRLHLPKEKLNTAQNTAPKRNKAGPRYQGARLLTARLASEHPVPSCSALSSPASVPSGLAPLSQPTQGRAGPGTVTSGLGSSLAHLLATQMVPSLERQLLICLPQTACRWEGRGKRRRSTQPPEAGLSLASQPHPSSLPLACGLAPSCPEGLPLTCSQPFWKKFLAPFTACSMKQGEGGASSPTTGGLLP